MELNILIPALIVAWMLDRFLADPSWLPHPVVVYGKLIAFFDKTCNRGKRRFIRGMLVTMILVTGVFLFFELLLMGIIQINIWLVTGLKAVFIFFGLAGTTLIREGKAVFEKLQTGIEEGRKQVGRIVGRDTTNLNSHEIKTATLETLAENLSDGVVAPLFWLAIAGVPGMMVYKMVNTLDSMIGYQNDKYEYFGKFAARLDDVANYIPARITALLMALCGFNSRAFQYIFRFGRAHKSPNAGFPEAALAGTLGVQFGGDHAYLGKLVPKPKIGTNLRTLNINDLKKTIQINRAVEISMIVLVVAAFIFTDLPWVAQRAEISFSNLFCCVFTLK
ncbi:adenosylcobinamide-phosphate synthase CbiB [Marinilabilia rubra]|uniref:Cobalamin biosynthesis protein CobD n=1 Tax=Marinilabilia rubra TaxID=2162893 RepID=A0A2U2B5S3_9BACT|nr:adenosylcobinamide-phosphate synthase CbiB [Marinilabilia rubra]PWD98417.1 cobalamin biosynthesis protein CobD [Marinilabilia rubra]